MAVRTISNTGGNWNAIGTWVEGAVPLAADTIVATATSGPLTINVVSSCAGADFTNYVSTLTVNFDFGIGGPAVFVPGMTISGTAYIALTGTSTVRTNGLVIPFLRFSGQNITRTLLDNMTVTNLLQQQGNQNPTISGSFTMSVTNFRTTGTGGGSYGWLNGAVPIVFNGPNCYYENTFTNQGITNHTIINTAGNFTISGTGSAAGIIALSTVFGTTAQLTYISGTVVGALNLSLYYGNNNSTTGIRLNTGSMGSKWSNIYIKDSTNITANSFNIINLLSPLRFDNMYITAMNNIPYTTIRRPIRFTGTSVLEGGTFSAQSQSINVNTTNLQTSLPAVIQFTPNAGTTHSFTNLNIIGSPNNKASIASTTASNVGLSFSNVLIYTDLSYAQAPSLTYVYGATISNTINFATASFGGGGGGESANTFVN